jgi:hypothetical protein
VPEIVFVHFAAVHCSLSILLLSIFVYNAKKRTSGMGTLARGMDRRQWTNSHGQTAMDKQLWTNNLGYEHEKDYGTIGMARPVAIYRGIVDFLVCVIIYKNKVSK